MDFTEWETKGTVKGFIFFSFPNYKDFATVELDNILNNSLNR